MRFLVIFLVVLAIVSQGNAMNLFGKCFTDTDCKDGNFLTDISFYLFL
jgi:hypothetical protein